MPLAHTALKALESEMLQQTAELSGPLLEVCRYAISGGKRVRATLLLEAAQRSDVSALRAAIAVEMLHAATLLQDDIFDAGSLRRGRTTAHLKFGKPLTILASDWLLIRALELAAEITPAFFRCLAKTAAAMAQAEAREFTPLPLCSVEEAQIHAEITSRGKTATLFGTALCGAAVLQQLPDNQRAAWQELGVEMGLTYQMVDDCVDLYGAEETAGKTLGHDLASGWLTLPVLLAVQSLGQHGIAVPLADLQAGCLGVAALTCLQRAIRSRAVLIQVQKRLALRLAQHARQGIQVGLDVEMIEKWIFGVQARLAYCFPDPAALFLYKQAYSSDAVWPAETGQDRA